MSTNFNNENHEEFQRHLPGIDKQGREWVNGKSEHNRERNECTPDFSCCMPALFEKSRAKRVAIFNEWASRHGRELET